MNLAERVGSRQNNFNALRLIAAVMVLVSHCFALTNRPEPLASISNESFGELGVSIFFAISGFLIARSWSGDPATPAIRRQAGAPLAAGTDRGRAAHRARARSGGHDPVAVRVTSAIPASTATS